MEMPNYSVSKENFLAEMQPAMTSSEDQSATISSRNAMDSQRSSVEEPPLEEKLFITGGSVLSPRILGPSTEMDNEAAVVPMRKSKGSETDSDVPNKRIKLGLFFDDLKADGTE